MQVTGLAAEREYRRLIFDLGRVEFKQPRDVVLFAIGPEFNPLLYSVREVRGQIREMVDFPANGAG